jgi:hypothetical protein
MPDASYQPAVYRKQGGAEFVVADGGALTVEAGGAVNFATGTKLTTGVLTATASFTAGAEDSSVTYLIGAANIVATLPATAAGLTYRFVLAAAALTTGVGFKVAPAAADAINGNGLTSVDGDTLLVAGSGDREGDFVSLIGDGSNGWYITSISGTWTKATS